MISENDTTHRDIIVIGASAGGVEALQLLVQALPASLNATIFVVVHFPMHATSTLPSLLDRYSEMPVVRAQDQKAIERGRIYVAPPNSHLLIRDGHIRLGRGATENGHRPAIDPLFRTAAMVYGPRAIGVILTGTLDDGSAGLKVIADRGGTTVVQDPDDALHGGMPRNAIAAVQRVDYIVPLQDIGPLLVSLVTEQREALPPPPIAPELHYEAHIATLDQAAIEGDQRPGKPSAFGCPDCGGVLWEIDDAEGFRFRCRVGHAYSPETLLAKEEKAIESALWIALRALEERGDLLKRMGSRAIQRGHTAANNVFQRNRADLEDRAELLRHILLQTPLEHHPVNEANRAQDPEAE